MSWIHSSAGLTPLLTDPFVRAIVEGLQRSLAEPVVKEPLSIEILGAIVQEVKEPGSLSYLKLATVSRTVWAS